MLDYQRTELYYRAMRVRVHALVLSLQFFGTLSPLGAESFRVATYNLENYTAQSSPSRPGKSGESRVRVVESILAIRPDVLAVQEIGEEPVLLELQGALEQKGLHLPYVEHVAGYDTNMFVGVLSRFPMVDRRSHTNASFLLHGRRLRTSRGFAEVDIQVTPTYRFTLIAAHLKSKRASAIGYEDEIRLEEAKLLREKVDLRLTADHEVNLVVAGDFNDTKDSPAIQTITGRGLKRLFDTRPGERKDPGMGGGSTRESRPVVWTHYFSREDSYQRLDYILVSPGMRREYVEEESYVFGTPGWGEASDHRPVVVGFVAVDR